MSDTRFWNAVERLEASFLGSQISETAFRAAMRRKGFDPEIIDERVEAIQSEYRMIYGCDHVSVNDPR